MKTYWTRELKPQVLENINKAGITNKEAIKTILTFEKSVNSARKLSVKQTWYTVCHSKPYNKAGDLLIKLNGHTYGTTDAPYWKEWAAYCDVRGALADANLGDWLA
jgi:hypothetical protein